MWSLPDFSDPAWFSITVLLVLVVLVARYFIIAGLFWCIFYVWFKDKWELYKLHQRAYSSRQFRKEVSWSLITSLIFAIAGALTLWVWQRGYTQVYERIDLYGWWYLPVSLVLSLFIHELYYYWVHRWMHRPAIFRIVHKVHHESNITSPWTAFSFHPLEGLLQALILPLILIIIPLHPYIILLQLVIMSVSSVINHLDIEIFPSWFYKHAVGRWLIGATHHSLHHKQFRYNYGLYFTFLDKMHGTESPAYGKNKKKEEK
jgi:lathosterol oxidase